MKTSAVIEFVRKIIVLNLGLAFSTLAFSQADSTMRRIDSLKSALVASSGQEKYDILDKLAYEYVYVVDSIALPYATRAFKMSWQYDDSARIVKSGRVKSMILNNLERYDSTIAISTLILPIAKRNNYLTEMKYLLNLVATAHMFKAEYDRALAYNFESLVLRKQYEDKASQSIALNNTGLVYYKMKSYAQALHYFEAALNVRSESGGWLTHVDSLDQASDMVNISLCHAFLNNLTLAKKSIAIATKICENGCSDRVLMGLSFAWGVVHYNSKSMQMASAKFQESLSLARKISDHRFELDNLIYLSEISLRSNQHAQAEKYLKQAESFAKSGLPFNLEFQKVYNQLSQLFTKRSDYRNVAFYQSKYIQFKDSIHNEEVTMKLMKVEAEYMERANQAKLTAQQEILTLSESVINRQKIINVVVSLVAILSIAFVFLLSQNIKQKKRLNLLLEQKVKERTLELELNHNLLLKSIKERDVQFQRVSNEVRSSLATIKGLGVLVSHDLGTTKASSYLAKIEETSNNLYQVLSHVHGNQFNGTL